MLRPYQQQAIEAVNEAWEDYKTVLLVMATGTGKTYTATRIAHDRKDEGRILWLAHRGELLDQAAETFTERVGLSCNVEKAELRAPREMDLWGARPVVVASVPTMRGRRLKEWDRTAFATIVIDEAHHAPAKTYRAILEHFTGAKVLGLTATPDRGDGVAMGGVFEHSAYEYDIRRGIREGYLCGIQQKEVQCADLDISNVTTVAGDLNQGQLQQAMIDGGVLHQTAAPLIELAGRRQTLVFTVGVAQAHALADVIAGYLGNSDLVKALDGKTDKETRRAYIADFRSGKIQFLINCAVLTEGFDAPETACIAVVRPTKSRSLYAQMIGRGTRPKADGGDCLILDFTGNSGRHRLITPLDVLAGKALDDDVLEDALGACADGQPSEEALLAAEQRKREREEAAAEARRRAQKIRAKVAYSTRNVSPFDFLGVSRDDSGGPPASEKQLRFLRNMGVDIEEGAGRFECSSMIDRLQRRRTKKLCSYKQARLLVRYGLPDGLSFDDARTAIDAIAGEESGKWKCPEWVVERFVTPEGE
jgi:superfamily II DNA or RNA helicase